MWNASQHADEFAIDYGEDFSATIKTSGMSSNYEVEEDALNFENELKRIEFLRNIIKEVENEYKGSKITFKENEK